MMGIKTRMALFLVVVLGIAGLCVLAVTHKPSEERMKDMMHKGSFDRNVADGMRLWNPKTGMDGIRFDSCRIEKMRMGAIYLGMLDVLCLDGLVLNLPLSGDDRDEGREMREEGKKNGVVEVLAGLLPQSFLQRAGVPIQGLAGIRIKGLVVNRVENRREVPVFAADGAKNHRQMLKLKNCRVFESGRTNDVGVAYFVLQPAPALVWKDGMRKLDDLFPNLSEVKGKKK